MTIYRKNQLTVIFLVISLITLFFGLNPKGYRFINQVKLLSNKNGLIFPNIGMMYSEKPLGEIGITESMSIVMSVRPFLIEKKLSKIISIIDSKGNELLSVEQWIDAIIVTLYDSNGKRVAKTGSGGFSMDTVNQVFVAIDENTMELAIGNQIQKRTISKGVIKRGFFSSAQMIIGLSPVGRNPFKGEMYNLALFNQKVNPALSLEILQNNQPAACFNFSGFTGRKVCDLSENRWHLDVPLFPKFFKYEPFQSFGNMDYPSRSSALDIFVNFSGFIPFGMAAFLFLIVRVKSKLTAVLYTLAFSLLITFLIETAQIFIPTRTSQLSDVLLNVAGAGTGALIIFYTNANRRLNHFAHNTKQRNRG